MRKYWCTTLNETNMRICTKAPNQLPRFGKTELLPYSGAP